MEDPIVNLLSLTTTKFEECMRYMKLRDWDSLHLAAQRDWSMEVINERERQWTARD